MDPTAKVEHTLKELGVHDLAGVEALVGELRAAFDAELKAVSSPEAAEKFRVRWVGRKQGLLGMANDRWLKTAPASLKREVGRRLNEFRDHAEKAVEGLEPRSRGGPLGRAEAAAPECLDVTLPGARRPLGARHPIRMVLEEIEEIFVGLGYSVETGPEIESDYYNFEALNMPAHHPSRDTWDTLYVAPSESGSPEGGGTEYVLRTHTSPVQIRTMEKQQPPLRVIVPGKVYRHDTPDASHSFMFHQVEGFAVDTNITLCDLKGTLDHFIRRMFGDEVRTRFRPSFFPFTEPSAEVDASCFACGGSGCRVCKQSGWIELLGCGMIDPALYGFVHYDPAKYSGFAFGMGVERMAMLKYDIDDIQVFFQGDVRFLRQFK